MMIIIIIIYLYSALQILCSMRFTKNYTHNYFVTLVHTSFKITDKTMYNVRRLEVLFIPLIYIMILDNQGKVALIFYYTAL